MDRDGNPASNKMFHSGIQNPVHRLARENPWMLNDHPGNRQMGCVSR